MTTSELHIKLKEAYTAQNLNKITVTLIYLYKEQQFGTLRHIAEMISETVDINLDSENRYFSKLMMLYHPDRGDFHRNKIDNLALNQDHDGLLGYSHILLLSRIEEIAATLTSYEDIDYSPVYEWDVNLDGFTIIDVNEDGGSEKKRRKPAHRKSLTFYDAVKIRMYGSTKVDFPFHYLEDLEEIELSQSGISDLDGVQYCFHAISMDLSGNNISDISLLWGLTQLRELNLSDNKIEDIYTLANLRNIRILDLSNNPVKDISALHNLNKLEYIVLTDLKVSQNQLRELEEKGGIVVV